MRNTAICLALVLASAGACATAPSIAAWHCQMQGSVVETKARHKWSFTGPLVWKRDDGLWKVSGTLKEPAHTSTITGTCTAQACTWVQRYTRGDMDGLEFHWDGRYSETFPKAQVRTVRLQGHWGTEPHGNEGTWNAQGRCTAG